MTVIAVIAAGNVRRMLAGGNNAVMAGSTTADDLGVVDDQHGHEHGRTMAVFADIRCLNVCRVLADRLCTVVAIYAVCCD